MNDNIGEMLKFDPLAVAEKVTGESYKEDEGTMNLGFAMAMMHNEHKESTLKSRGDSWFNMPFLDQLGVFVSLGFQVVLRDAFRGRYGPEKYVILWHSDGLLATCESFEATRRNNAKVYYNFRRADGGYPSGLTSSGHMQGDVWVGDHDAREGIRYHLDAFRAEGEFLPQWIERPFLWLVNYAESDVKDYDYKAINAERISRLPKHVQDAITPVDGGIER